MFKYYYEMYNVYEYVGVTAEIPLTVDERRLCSYYLENVDHTDVEFCEMHWFKDGKGDIEVCSDNLLAEIIVWADDDGVIMEYDEDYREWEFGGFHQDLKEYLDENFIDIKENILENAEEWLEEQIKYNLNLNHFKEYDYSSMREYILSNY